MDYKELLGNWGLHLPFGEQYISILKVSGGLDMMGCCIFGAVYKCCRQPSRAQIQA